jgi:hypothetical protein
VTIGAGELEAFMADQIEEAEVNPLISDSRAMDDSSCRDIL